MVYFSHYEKKKTTHQDWQNQDSEDDSIRAYLLNDRTGLWGFEAENWADIEGKVMTNNEIIKKLEQFNPRSSLAIKRLRAWNPKLTVKEKGLAAFR